MGLFDRIKKAFTGEQTDEPEKQEEVVEETKDSSENGDGVETTEVTKDTDSEDALETDEVAERSAEEEEEALEQAAETIDVPAEEVLPAEPEIPDLTEETEEVAQPTHEDDDTSVTENEAVEDEKAPEVEETIPEAEPEIEQSSDVDQSEETVQEKYDKGLEKTRKSFGDRMNELFARFRRVDEDFFEELEETLIGADVGFDTAIKLTDSLRQEVKLKNAKKPAQIQNVIIEKLVEIYEAEGINENNKINLQNDGLSVILFVGVNGTGKTTSIGKLANQYKNEGKKVLLAAADTFRAGAIDQLVVWGERSGVEVVRGNAGGDPAAVVFDAVDKAKKENYDILLIDTAGRLQNKVNLMNELEKIKRVIQREFPTAPHEVLLVVDATTGQNALVQARQFKETTDVTGLVLTKLDGTAKGGIVLAIRNELHLPVKLVGLGEGINDLEAFDSNDFAVGLFKGLLKEE
ncbi:MULTISPECIES: signal recognition particle-docking protein FtsY [Enterococcus]|uniref:Signal recognition particle receptor FtsY n=1 Tax=Enterococcus gilvus ATCC BAA-350 TaxID=1158614 RepID=R2XFV2_9ENTE|nr:MULTISPECIES: signal recognition particle-docking protein FtsY [Enterococcus]EOI53734.1 signal recognition particle-docking protein FtsY [Enterococcus gilvus ATCC BAA-350]EOW80991.1 signal recognition particle-docking protein FtsY [Enterococcus gilvus ATCC BAA-350]MBS5819917.1 signal recognition particle-docking protein FtsY [Enterococcus gilvus]OJG41922.1 signal recognition particle-docking protein FtsY [Enterococcus gilvus]OTO71198.1 signal recognition particle-docking protein FtsY [Enter